ncbi:hypothetical protein LMG24238_06086 [Paraburkholderia sediminicola]|uniref:Uncharacterized protein n=1 Tax=Paraburkholderia sediminicola TaxID=458836 RepID=A0A6J5CH28_9BURK|nr:hypothetical protein LMG24238_06086 [Paraburkholderia sediminicola]
MRRQRLRKRLFQLRGIARSLSLRHHVGDEPPPFMRQHPCLTHHRQHRQHRLDFSEFDPETADLHLRIVTADIDDPAIGFTPRHIA